MANEKIALVGNPNIGKSSLFNQLTGLKQHVGNYPGITIEKTTGSLAINDQTYVLYDLPGVYSIYPNSQDEEIVAEVLLNKSHPDHPDKIIIVANGANLKRSLLLVEQVVDLGIPSMLVLNMIDEADRLNIKINHQSLASHFGIPVISTNARKGIGIQDLKTNIDKMVKPNHHSFECGTEYLNAVNDLSLSIPNLTTYEVWQLLAQPEVEWINGPEAELLKRVKLEHKIIPRRLQVSETLHRYRQIDDLLQKAVIRTSDSYQTISAKMDKWIMHPFWGYLIFFLIIFFIFQSIFTLSNYPMQLIETGFSQLNFWIKSILPNGPLNGFITDGIVTGLGGIVIFIPQILILFLFLLLMEQTGYMSRVVYLMDRWMQPFGLNGKSVVPLISGAACAVPAIMSARNIENRKERQITILATPFMTCSARLPVYTMIIGLVIPDERIAGISIQGLVLLLMYILGVATALMAGFIYQRFIKTKYKSYLIIELPNYRLPLLKNVVISLYDKVKSFVWGAGKIILVLSMILWVLASFGPNEKFKNAEETVRAEYLSVELSDKDLQSKIGTYKLQYSFLGYLGKSIEPAIKPLGYDWKIGIGILSSFAAREVFVPTMATIYSMDDKLDDKGISTLKTRMKNEVNPKTGEPVYNLASGISLLLFYAFAMMCMSTLATVKRETNSWKWPLIQLISMTGLAYLIALIVYQLIK